MSPRLTRDWEWIVAWGGSLAFFLSGRRRHTRLQGDWSSDVCSSDLEAIGVRTVSRREANAFPENHVQLLRTFADQAVIAIENVRLFDEVQAKTRDLGEALEQDRKSVV